MPDHPKPLISGKFIFQGIQEGYGDTRVTAASAGGSRQQQHHEKKPHSSSAISHHDVMKSANSGAFFARNKVNAHQVHPADYPPSSPSTTPQSTVPGSYKRSSSSLKRDSRTTHWIGAAIFRMFKRLPTIPSSQSP